METLHQLLNHFIHVDNYLITFVAQYGIWTYAILFAIIFCETGLIITPFLPGDSLLFAAGSIAAQGNVLDIKILFILLTLASILGNKINYLMGRRIGPKIFNTRSRFFSKHHLLQAHYYYEKHGGKTIVYARFLPIIRTFIPFIAGVAYMRVTKFSLYNLLSAVLWIGSLLFAGHYLGAIPLIQQNFSLVIYGIILFTIIPPTLLLIYKKLSPIKSPKIL